MSVFSSRDTQLLQTFQEGRVLVAFSLSLVECVECGLESVVVSFAQSSCQVGLRRCCGIEVADVVRKI